MLRRSKKIIELIKNRAVFQFYPSVFTDDAEADCPEGFEKVSKCKDHHAHMIVVSNYEITSGIENFNLANFELIEDARLFLLATRLGWDGSCHFADPNAREVAGSMKACLEKDVRISCPSTLCIHPENYNSLKLYMGSGLQRLEEQIKAILGI